MRKLLIILACCFAFESMAVETFTNSIGMSFVKINEGDSPSANPIEAKEPCDPSATECADGKSAYPGDIGHAYWIGQTEVTQAQWVKVMGKNPSHFKGDNRPVERVNYREITRFLKKLNKMESKQYRLPTEWEWEYAARAGATTPFYTGTCISTDQANYDGNYPPPDCPKGRYRKETVDVGSFQANAWGLHDMHGNVWEWTCTLHDKPYGKQCDPASSKGRRVLRGGGWNDNSYAIRLENRASSGPKSRYYIFGFRIVLPAATTEE